MLPIYNLPPNRISKKGRKGMIEKDVKLFEEKKFNVTGADNIWP